jgi:hypothetical protein
MTSEWVAAAATSAAAPWGPVPGPADAVGVRATIREYRDGNPSADGDPGRQPDRIFAGNVGDDNALADVARWLRGLKS